MAELVGRYEVVRRLATGGMGEVLLATLSGTETLVVIKRVLPHLADDPEFRALFLDEARISSRLRHPNIAQIIELGDVTGRPYLVMEYVAGVDLRALGAALQAKGQALPVGLACRIVADAAAALAYAHASRDGNDRSMQVVHQDVSPHNVLVSFEGVVKVIDFGVARATSQGRGAEPRALRGKLAYMSPEQVAEDELDHRSDQFSLGAVLFELLTGQPLFRHDDDAVTLQAVAAGAVRSPREVVPSLPAALEAIVLRMLATDRAQRFVDCGAVRVALEDFVLEAGLSASTAHLAQLMRTLFPDAAPSTPRPSRAPVPQRPPPRPTTSFVGRTTELAALARLVNAGAKVVTLVGPGGIGKTRLALELAQSLEWPCVLADVTEASDQQGVCAAVAVGLGVSGALDAPLGVARALADREPCVVVLDGVTGAPPEAFLGWRSPASVLLATSRAPLALPGEHCFEVAALAEADALLLERVKLRRPAPQLSEADRQAIVRRGDGVPLAIELAAAQVAQALASTLPGPLETREATLRAIIEWSWALLAPHEQATLAQLSAFRGGFTLEAVEAAIDLAAFPEAPWPLDVVQTLQEKALVASDEVEGVLRFRLLEPVRAFAAEIRARS